MWRKKGEFDATLSVLKDLHLQRSEAMKEIADLALSFGDLPEDPTEVDLDEHKEALEKRHQKILAAAARVNRASTEATAIVDAAISGVVETPGDEA